MVHSIMIGIDDAKICFAIVYNVYKFYTVLQSFQQNKDKLLSLL